MQLALGAVSSTKRERLLWLPAGAVLLTHRGGSEGKAADLSHIVPALQCQTLPVDLNTTSEPTSR